MITDQNSSDEVLISDHPSKSVAVFYPILDTPYPHSHNDLPGILRMWRNWQTRRSQKPVMVTSWRFKSSHPHQREVRRVSSETRLFVSLNRFLTTLNKSPHAQMQK